MPGNSLSGYMQPLFGQSWSVFAPEPVNGDFTFSVRAVLESQGELEVTEWVSATDVEMSLVHHNPFPPRAALGATVLATNLKNSYDSLSEEQRRQAGNDFFKDRWEERLRAAVRDEGAVGAADRFLKNDRLATAYATQVAGALWGDEVVRVQYQVGRQGVIPFTDRDDPEAVRPDPVLLDTGYRGVLVLPGQSSENFSAVFSAQYERTQQ